jgi:hypothetical protein
MLFDAAYYAVFVAELDFEDFAAVAATEIPDPRVHKHPATPKGGY